MKLQFLSLATLLISAGTAFGAIHHVTVGKIKPVRLTLGHSALLVIPITVEAGLHIQANPPSRPGFIPTTLAITSAHGVSSARPIYPPGKPYRMFGERLEISAYQGTVEIRAPLSASQSASKGHSILEAEITAQACNDKICYPIDRIKVVIPVDVVKK